MCAFFLVYLYIKNKIMELKIELTVQNSDISFDSELKAVSVWNTNNTNNQIYYIKGNLETYRGNIDIVSEEWNIQHYYVYSPNPTRKPHVYLAIDGNSLTVDIDVLDNLISESNSVIIGVMRYAETLCLSKKEDFSWIKVKKFDETQYSTIEEKYEALQKHHQEEVGFLIDYINKNCKNE
jgi:hypothetical protein